MGGWRNEEGGGRREKGGEEGRRDVTYLSYFSVTDTLFVLQFFSDGGRECFI